MTIPAANSPKTRSRSGPIAALVLVAVLIGYPLSIGPAALMVERRLAPPNVMRAYAPLTWLTDMSPATRNAIGRYLDFWVTPPGMGG